MKYKYHTPCKCRWRDCGKRAVFVVSDNESLSGFTLCCAEHLRKSINNAFQFNEPCKPKNDLVIVRKITHLDNKLRRDFYLKLKPN